MKGAIVFLLLFGFGISRTATTTVPAAPAGTTDQSQTGTPSAAPSTTGKTDSSTATSTTSLLTTTTTPPTTTTESLQTTSSDSTSESSATSSKPLTSAVDSSASSPTPTTATTTTSTAPGDANSSQNPTSVSDATGDASGSSVSSSQTTSSTPAPNQCYEHTCNATTDSCLADDLKNENITVDRCPRDKFCKITRTLKSKTYSIEAKCVDVQCDYQDMSTDSTGREISNCCDDHLCNTESILKSSASMTMQGYLPWLLGVLAVSYYMYLA